MQDDGIIVRFPVAAISRCRVDPDQVVFVTRRPFGGGRVPVADLVDGGRERLLGLLGPVVG